MLTKKEVFFFLSGSKKEVEHNLNRDNYIPNLYSVFTYSAFLLYSQTYKTQIYKIFIIIMYVIFICRM